MRIPLLLTAAAIAWLTAVGCQDTTGPLTSHPPQFASPSQATPGALVFREVSAGHEHTCGVTTGDVAYCWGYNDAGQLGNDTSEWDPHPRPVPVVGIVKFRTVLAGTGFSCGLGTGYRIHCWGANYDGQLGDGTKQDRQIPTQVASGLRFRQVVTGAQHACAIGYSDSLAYCWGSNWEGNLGDGTRTGHTSPFRVSGTRRWRQLSAGYRHTCGITMGQRLFCWGSNSFGQLGDSTDVTRLRPVRVAAGTLKFKQVSAATWHTCAISTAGKAFCWGRGPNGGLGIGKTLRLSRWPRAVAGGFSFESISAGGWVGVEFACGVTSLHRTYCWGSNGWGQLGDGTTTGRLAPVLGAGGLALAQVSAGSDHTCGTTAAGIGYCWGLNVDGRLGDGTTVSRLRPVAIVGPGSVAEAAEMTPHQGYGPVVSR
jgi:alpha-tubulin suppressor-like RCC1 family protein